MIQIAEIAYYGYFTVLFGAKMLGFSEGQPVFNVALVSGAAFFMLKVLMTEHTVAEYLCGGALLLLAGIVYLRTGEKGLMVCFTMMLGMKGVPVRRVMLLSAWIAGICLSLMTILSCIGVIREEVYILDRPPLGQIVRHTFGYPHTNTLMITYCVFMMAVLYCVGNRSKKLTMGVSLWLLVMLFYYYLCTNSRTGLLAGIIYLILNYWLQFHARFHAWEKAACHAVYPLAAGIPILGAILYTEEPAIGVLRTILHRFQLGHAYLAENRIRLFGTRLIMPEDIGNYSVDISYLYLLLCLGVAAFLVMSVLQVLLVRYCINRKQRGALAVTLTLFIMGMSEPLLYNLSFKNLTFLFLGEMLYELLAGYKEGIWGRAVRGMRIGSSEVPASVSEGVAHLRESAKTAVLTAGRRKSVWVTATVLSAALAACYGVLMASRLTPLEGSMETARYELWCDTASVAVWGTMGCCMVMMVIMRRGQTK